MTTVTMYNINATIFAHCQCLCVTSYPRYYRAYVESIFCKLFDFIRTKNINITLHVKCDRIKIKIVVCIGIIGLDNPIEFIGTVTQFY